MTGAADVTIIGAGSWGTALAIHLARYGQHVCLWGRDPEKVADMAVHRVNRRYLPDIGFPAHLEPEADLGRALTDTGLVVFAGPSDAFAEQLDRTIAAAPGLGALAWVSKGFEPGTGRFLHEVARDRLPEAPLAVLTGPSFAKEVALGLPTAVTVAGTDGDFVTRVASTFHAGTFRAYISDDLVGAELGGAVKNVMAIATGIADGMHLGDNARAALMTRGLAEILRLADALGAQRETLTGLAGMGDLVLTCTGDLSRNRRFGLKLGGGADTAEALAEIGQVVEGVKAAREVMRLAGRHGVEMPISEVICALLDGRISPREGLHRLLSREQKAE